MKTTYALIGIGFLILIGVFIYFMPNEEETVDDTIVGMKLVSTAFLEGESIPSKFTCDAENVSPALSISSVPDNAKSLVLIMDDPDVPKELKPDGVFNHWVVYGLDPGTREIPEGAQGMALGLNGAENAGYTGPCPPQQYEPSEHRYFFTLYALDTTLNFVKAPTKEELLTAIESHVVKKTELIGRYKRITQP